jgi:dihydroxyacetone kinase-like predicted kinase
VGAALQAAMLARLNNVSVLPTKNMAQGYYAKAMDLSDDENFDLRMKEMENGANCAQTIAISVATRDFFGEITCRKGDFIALLNEQPICSSPSFEEVLVKALEKVPYIDEKENAILFKGAGASVEIEDTVCRVFAQNYPDIECEYIDGGQGVFTYIIGF